MALTDFNVQKSIHHLRCRGLWLHEIIQAREFSTEETPDNQRAVQRLQRWKHNAGRVHHQGLSRRLLWSGWPQDDASLLNILLTPIEAAVTDSDWASSAWSFFDAVRQQGVCADPCPERPFSLLIDVMASRVIDNIKHTHCVAWQLVSVASEQVLLSVLADRVGNVFNRCLQAEFVVYREYMQRQEAGEAGYQAFCQMIIDDDHQAFFIKYAAATRRAYQILMDTQQAYEYFILAFYQDRQKLFDLQWLSHADATLERIELSLSDPHEGGQGVVCCYVSSGECLYFKPRSRALEAGVGQLYQEIFNDDPCRGLIVATLDCGQHAWSQAAKKCWPCPSNYYQGAGRLIAFAYAFGITDLHAENLLLGESGPIIADGETVFSPWIQRDGVNDNGTDDFIESLTVLRSGLIPEWRTFGDGQNMQVSGLGCGNTALTDWSTEIWQQVNTDAMMVRTEKKAYFPDAEMDITRFHSEYPAENFIDEMLQGFDQAYQQLMSWWQKPSAGERLKTVAGLASTRILVRETTLYGLMLENLRDPRFAQTGLDTSIELELLAAALTSHDECPRSWLLLQEEITALLQGDVPLFNVKVEQAFYRRSDGSKCDILKYSGLDSTTERLNRLGDSDHYLQARFISAAFEALRSTSVAASALHPAVAVQDTSPAGGGQDSLLSAVHQIIKILSQAKMQTAGGRGIWVGIQSAGRSSRAHLKPLGLSLYDGVGGLAVFFAAAAKVCQSQEYESLARETLWNAMDSHALERWSSDLDVEKGLVTGRTGFVRSLFLVGKLLGDDSFLQAARSYALPKALSQAHQDISYMDLYGGAIGEYLVLKELGVDQSLRGKQRLDELEQALTQHFFNHRLGTESHALPQSHDLGFAHGWSGLLYGLGRVDLFSALHQQGVQLMIKVLAEQRESVLKSEVVGWAHGWTGVHFLRHQDPLFATALTSLDLALPEDDPCMVWDALMFGNAGCIENALISGQKDQAYALALAVVKAQQTRGGFALPHQPGFSLGLFDGLPGVGYALLRALEPENIPSLIY